MSVAAPVSLQIIREVSPGSVLTVPDVTWEDYEELLEEVGEASGVRISYCDGTLQIMTLSAKHEYYARLIERFINALSLRLQIKVLFYGSTTMRKKRKRKGLEPDACFYIQSADRLHNKLEIDFATDPPPDIVVEIDIHHGSILKFPIYAALEIPEVWVWDEQQLAIFQLQGESYRTVEASLALPMLTSNTLTEFLSRAQQEDQHEILLAFDEWLKAQQQ